MSQKQGTKFKVINGSVRFKGERYPQGSTNLELDEKTAVQLLSSGIIEEYVEPKPEPKAAQANNSRNANKTGDKK